VSSTIGHFFACKSIPLNTGKAVKGKTLVKTAHL